MKSTCPREIYMVIKTSRQGKAYTKHSPYCKCFQNDCSRPFHLFYICSTPHISVYLNILVTLYSPERGPRTGDGNKNMAAYWLPVLSMNVLVLLPNQQTNCHLKKKKQSPMFLVTVLPVRSFHCVSFCSPNIIESPGCSSLG